MHPICWTDRSPVRKPGFRYGQHACTVRIRHDSRLSWLVATTWLNRPSASANQNQPATLSASTGCARRRMRPRMNSTEGNSLRAVGRHPHAMAWGCLATVIVHAPRRSGLAGDDATITSMSDPPAWISSAGRPPEPLARRIDHGVPGRCSHTEPFTGAESTIRVFPGSGLQLLLTWRPGADEMPPPAQLRGPGHGGSGVARTVAGGRPSGIVIAPPPSRAAPRRAGVHGDADVAATRRASGAPSSSPSVAPR